MISVPCAYCGVAMWRRPYEIAKAQRHGWRHYCSHEHRNIGRFSDKAPEAGNQDGIHPLVAAIRSINSRREALFWSKVGRGDDQSLCWLWSGAKNAYGYGQTSIRGIAAGAHQVAYVMNGGDLLMGQVVRHECDTPPCCNPSHLIAGTQTDNYNDSFERQRAACGSKCRHTKLNEDIVAEILRDDRSQAAIAAVYGVNQSTVSLIKGGKTWKIVSSPPPLLRSIRGITP